MKININIEASPNEEKMAASILSSLSTLFEQGLDFQQEKQSKKNVIVSLSLNNQECNDPLQQTLISLDSMTVCGCSLLLFCRSVLAFLRSYSSPIISRYFSFIDVHLISL